MDFLANHQLSFVSIVAIFSVALTQGMKLYDRIPWLSEFTNSANRIFSVGLAVLFTAAFHWKEFFVSGTHLNVAQLTKDAAVQWTAQEAVYRVGWKTMIISALTALGLGPKVTQVTQEAIPTASSDGMTGAIPVDTTKVTIDHGTVTEVATDKK